MFGHSRTTQGAASQEERLCINCERLIKDCLSFFTRVASSHKLPPASLTWLDTTQTFLHHSDSSSLKRSVSQGCLLCPLLLREIERHSSSNSTERIRLSYYSPGESSPYYFHHSDGSFRNAPTANISIDLPDDSIASSPVLQFWRGDASNIPTLCDRLMGNVLSKPSSYEYMKQAKVFAFKIVPDAGSHDRFGLAARWLNDCLENHFVCKDVKRSALSRNAMANMSRSGTTEVPSRVLDVTPQEREDSVRLLDRSSLPRRKRHSKYIALSHCWGGNIESKTTRGNLSSRSESLPMSELPKTFRDAIVITRALGIRYLWIDGKNV